MKLVVGNKLQEITLEQFQKKKKEYREIELDLGTGNGRYIYKKAQENPEKLYIGIDPAEKQLRKYSKKAIRKNLGNALFVLASAEMLPKELVDSADRLNILLPWGSLLDYVANFEKKRIQEILNLLKSKGILRIIFGYNLEQEPTETERLELEKLDKKYVEEKLIPKYENLNLELLEYKKLEKEELRNLETSWSKKLSFGKPRPVFHIEFQKA